MKTFSQYLEEANSKYIVSKNPQDKKWYVMGHVGRNKWMPVSNGFKNKKVTVKKIGKNEKGDITINDKPMLKFRIIKQED